jgi:hypothetical protein
MFFVDTNNSFNKWLSTFSNLIIVWMGLEYIFILQYIVSNIVFSEIYILII